MRGALVDRLLSNGRVRGAEVAEAFRQVPRHLFVPEVDPPRAYDDEAIPIKWQADGRPVSSSSQPAMMAIMLEQLGLEAGHRVLEIGTGTGYNSASRYRSHTSTIRHLRTHFAWTFPDITPAKMVEK